MKIVMWLVIIGTGTVILLSSVAGWVDRRGRGGRGWGLVVWWAGLWGGLDGAGLGVGYRWGWAGRRPQVRREVGAWGGTVLLPRGEGAGGNALPALVTATRGEGGG